MSNTRLDSRTIFYLTVPPLLWAGNAVVGRWMAGSVPPITLNFLRWALACIFLMPWAAWVLKKNSPLWKHWTRYAVLGLLGVGCYNALQYLALKTSTPLNVTLIAASMPVWMIATGALFFGQRVTPRQIVGAVLSIAGVLVVLSRGDWQVIANLHLVPGDCYVLIAAAAWAVYSWLLTQREKDPPEIRNDWAAFLMAQIVMGLVWSGLFAAGEWATTDAHIVWGWPVVIALMYIAIAPAILAYRYWGLGIQRAGPNLAAFFSNLTPLFAAIMSTGLGELPHLYHAVAFVLIVGGIVVSSRKG